MSKLEFEHFETTPEYQEEPKCDKDLRLKDRDIADSVAHNMEHLGRQIGYNVALPFDGWLHVGALVTIKSHKKPVDRVYTVVGFIDQRDVDHPASRWWAILVPIGGIRAYTHPADDLEQAGAFTIATVVSACGRIPSS